MVLYIRTLWAVLLGTALVGVASRIPAAAATGRFFFAAFLGLLAAGAWWLFALALVQLERARPFSNSPLIRPHNSLPSQDLRERRF